VVHRSLLLFTQIHVNSASAFTEPEPGHDSWRSALQTVSTDAPIPLQFPASVKGRGGKQLI
jgi:hypothetical protein